MKNILAILTLLFIVVSAQFVDKETPWEIYLMLCAILTFLMWAEENK